MQRLCAAVVPILVIWGCACNKAPSRKAALTTDVERFSYAMGLDIGASLMNLHTEVDVATLAQAISDTIEGHVLLMTPEEAQQVRTEFTRAYRDSQAARAREAAARNLEESTTFLEQNKTREGVVTTASGLQYIIVAPGSGPRPRITDKVKVHYRGTLIDGTEFDSSYRREQPSVFTIGDVIPGWREALLLMPVGSTYRFFIPPQLAYGPRSPGPPIGPNATLIFEIEMLGIE